jgi:S-adenosylmethionine hydrolase
MTDRIERIQEPPRVVTREVVTFLTDFGWDGGYVAACEAVMASISPRTRVIHLSHEIAVGDVSAGALVLQRVAPLCPPSVHLAVIDPGVGTSRRPLALVTHRGDTLVGPDNGLLLPAADALAGVAAAWLLDPIRLRERAGLAGSPPSSTFHGRDVFAPAAALLSLGDDPRHFAEGTEPSSLLRLPPPAWHATPGGAVAEVVEIDRFGNVGLAVRYDELTDLGDSLTVEVAGEDLPPWDARVVETFGQLRPGELGVLCDSWGQLALALNGASAAQLLSVERGMSVRLSATSPAPQQDSEV